MKRKSGRGHRPPVVERRKKAPRKSRRTRGKRRGNLLTRAARGLVALLARALWAAVWRIGVVVVLLVALATFYFISTLPPASALIAGGRTRGSVTMLDRYGKVFAWRGQQYGGKITAASISPYLKNAVIATEDKRFYHHFGVSPRGIASAIRINLAAGRGPFSGNGGSTITQQVAKLLCLGRPYKSASGLSEAQYQAECRRSTLWRKIKEVPYAFAMEAKYSKDQILTIYLNRVYLGAGTIGFEAASQRYFGKSAANVTPAEAAMLAGLLVAPSYFAPTRSLKRAQGRADVIIGLMRAQGYLSAAQAADAKVHPARLSAAANARAGGYFADWVMETGPAFLTRDTTEDVIIRTTFDPRIQRAAEDALTAVFANKLRKGSKTQAAIVVMSPDGAVRAMVGGRKLTGVAGQFNRATQALRQTGSAFKPFVYAAALEQGYRTDSIVEDAPLTIDIPGSGPWSPRNYSGKFAGPVTLTFALQHSLNTAAVRVSEAVGRANVRRIARGFGLRSSLAAGPALALGASAATPLEMTGAYAGILNGGSSVTPYGLISLRLRGDAQPLTGKGGGIGKRVISRETDRELIYMMNQVINGGTGRRAKLPDRQAAGKTGTTQGARDAWFLGFTADYVAGVWMGYDDNTRLTGVTGGGLPAEIWRETMIRVDKGLAVKPLPMFDPTLAPPSPRAAPGIAPKPARGLDPVTQILRQLLGGFGGGKTR